MDIRHSLHTDLRDAVDDGGCDRPGSTRICSAARNPLVESYRCDDAEVVALSLGLFHISCVLLWMNSGGGLKVAAPVEIVPAVSDQALIGCSQAKNGSSYSRKR